MNLARKVKERGVYIESSRVFGDVKSISLLVIFGNKDVCYGESSKNINCIAEHSGIYKNWG